jgi:carbamoyl-phosphate synthase/aspartate carbamoyltransferase/dihydroorotase
MPNTSPPLTTPAVLEETLTTAAKTTRCQVGLFAGASPEQIAHLPSLAPYTVALKIYLNDTFGPLRVEDLPTLKACFETWPRHKLIAMHAEGQSVAVGIGLAASYQRAVHFCHISRQEEIELIATAKAQNLPVTCEVCPHHLYLSEADTARLGPYGDMRPRLARQSDVAALWAHLNTTIDCIATDHAPHTRTEKESDSPPPGVPGVETSLPLMLTAVSEGRLTLDRLIELMHHNPRRIFNLPAQTDTFVEVDPTARYTLRAENLHSKCGWTPFEGMTLTGRIERVVLNGREVVKQGQVLAQAGSGSVWRGG